MNTQMTRTDHHQHTNTALPKPAWLSPDILLLAGLTIILNLHLIGKGTIQSLLFLPDFVTAGEWWRLFTHPFVHITWYHLFLDAGAFFLLYAGLEDTSSLHRVRHTLICGMFSLAAAWAFTPAVNSLGLCGLSGIAHGLMAVSGLEMMQKKKTFRLGLICLVLVVAKSIYEVYINNSLFAFLQFGLCGIPLVACHAGGVVGGIISYLLNKCFQSPEPSFS